MVSFDFEYTCLCMYYVTSYFNQQAFDALRNAEAGFDEEEDKRLFSEVTGDFLESYEYHSERAESEESLERIGYDENKATTLNIDGQVGSSALEYENEKICKTGISS